MSIALVFDLETTHKGGPDNDSPEAHWPINEVVLAGWAVIDTDTGACVEPPQTGTMEAFLSFADGAMLDYIVAHNLKFDLKYVRRAKHTSLWPRLQLWCTMTHEYLSSGHAHKFSSLEDSCARRGIKTTKTMNLSEYIENGGRVEDIPKKELTEYLLTDVMLAAELFLTQHKDKKHFNMNYISALSEMELNGLPIDNDKLTKRAQESADICDKFTSYMKDKIKSNCEWVDGSPVTDADFEKKIKPTANRTLSFLLTGQPETLKTTSDKWTLQHIMAGTTLNASDCGKVWTDPPNHLGYSMDEKHIAKLCKVFPHSWVTKIPEWRKHDKLLNTYYLPFLTVSKFTGCIHPKLNTTATATGRLSSSKPNGQNMPKEARELVTAPEGYKLCELDFSQLEVVALAMLCGDKQLIDDIKKGEDIHFNTGKMVMGWKTPSDMDKETRRKVKNVNFGAIYGGKAPGLSYQTGIDKATVQKLINHLYHRYPGIATWQRSFYEDVVENMQANGHDDNGEQLYKSTVEQGGRTYTFFETPSPKWLRAKMGRSYSFNPNQVYNYPIQGFAGWSIVLQFLYTLWENTGYAEKFLMTVHDSILVMVPDNVMDEFEGAVEMSLEEFKDKFDINMPLQVELEWGTNWS